MRRYAKRDFLKLTSSSALLLGGAAPVSAQATAFSAGNFTAPASANVGDSVTAVVDITNNGTADGTVAVEYRIGGQTTASKSLPLGGGSSRTVTLRGTVPETASGERPHGIYLDGGATAATASTIRINPSPTEFVVEGIRPATTDGRVGDDISATATVRNRGETSDTTRVQYRIQDRVVAEQELTVNGGETRVVTLSGQVPTVPAGDTRQGVFVGETNVGVDQSVTIRAEDALFSIPTWTGPSRTAAAESVTATATVRNTGNSTGTTTVDYEIGETRIASREVTLGAGERTSINLTGDLPDRSAGSYQQGVSVRATDTGFTSPLRIETSLFSVAQLDAPSAAAVGEQLTVTARVTNNGRTRRGSPIEYRIDGQRVARKTVDLGAGETTTVTFSVPVPDNRPRTYEHGVFVDASTTGQTTSLRIHDWPLVTLTDFEGPRTATVGEELTATATLRNRGDGRDTRTVEYRIGRHTIAEQYVWITSGSEKSVTLSGTVPSVVAGSYTHGVAVDGDSSTNSVHIAAPADTAFSVSTVSGATEGAVGDTVSAEATVENTGTESGSITVEYRINGRIVDGQSVTVAAGDSETVSFDAPVPDVAAGDYTAGVFIANTTRGRTRTFTVTDSEGRTDDGAPGFGIGTAAAGTAGAAYLYGRYGSSGDDAERVE
ncbi:hypothetical protein EGH24_02035 [Halonotius terrestris]|uniref:CARDB domain-containing protein n=1 Tax=Halonotius terrestris TaxID=2487750 RepID=A0A8J8PE10_9EURY|nr:CARDB domain-containing protein [Halonotius terrestris]TQQ83595.1 hypothetical protein EGH24_02035 [Halonotius terrestris]